MADDYLWDRSGKPDPETERLERVLGTLRHVERSGAPQRDRTPERSEAAPPKPIPIDASHHRVARRGRGWLAGAGRRRVLLIAAAFSLVAGVLWGLRRPAARPLSAARMGPRVVLPPPVAAAWRVERLAGQPTCNGVRIEGEGRLGVGEWIETDAGGRARIEVAGLGEVEVGGQSRVRLTGTGPSLHRLDLARGSISARVEAPPRLFVVGTPAATAVDLGCAYTLEVDDHGAGVLRVTAGWVSLEDGGRASLVPAGATCRTRPGVGPGTPWFQDAAPELSEALARFDFEGGGEAAVRAVLNAARRRDALTLWHLLSRVDSALRQAVFSKLKALAPPPAGVGEPEVMRLDAPALDQWKNDLSVTW